MNTIIKRKTKQKIVSVFVSTATALWLSGAVALMPTAAQALTAADLQAQIETLLAQITALQSQLATLQGGTTGAGLGFTFSTDLKVGSTGQDVKNLQIALNSDSATQVAASGVGSSGNESTYFGSLTKAAVIKFQNKYAADVLMPIGLTAGTGYVGSMTRAKLNALYGGAVVTTPTTPTTPGTTPTTPATAGTLKVESGTQPAATLAPDNAARIPFTVVKLTAPADQDITVSSLTVERTGLANDAVFSAVLLLDENGIQVGLEKTLNSLHQAVLSEAFTVSKGTSKTMTIAGNRADTSTHAGEIAYLSLVAVNAGTATIDGVLPISGAGHTINESLAIGTVTMDRGSFDPGANQTAKEIGTTGYTFSSVKVTAGSNEKVKLLSIRWYQSGSAASGDLENIKTYVDGTAYDVAVSSNGKYYTASFPDGGLLIDKGFSKELSIKGDIIGGSARTIDFDVFKRTDIYVKGETYKYGITPPNGTDTSGTDDGAFHQSSEPWYDAFEVTVSSGTITVSTSSAVPADNVAINLANQPLGAFTTNVKGETISVAAIAFNVTIGNLTASSETVADITNVSLYDENGAVVAGPVDGTATESNNNGATGTSHGEIRFSDTVNFPTGLHTYTLKAKYGTNFDTNDTVTASTTPRNFGTATGLTTGNTITVNPNSILTLSQMTIKAGALAISVSTDPAAQTVIANTSQFTFAKYVLDATASGEDVRVTSLPLEYNVAAGSAGDLTNCKMYDGANVITTGSNVVNPSAVSSSTTFTFDGSGLTITKGTSKLIALKCDVIGSVSADNKYYWGLDGAQTTFTGASGLTSGQTIAETMTDSIGQAMTAQTGGTLTVTKDVGSPGYKIAAAGATNVEFVKIKFVAANEDVDLKKVALQLTNVASNSPSNLVNGRVTLWKDATTQVGEAVFSTGDFATSSSITNFRIPRNGAMVLTVKGDLAGISTDAVIARSGDLLIVNYDGNSTGLANGAYGVGVSSGNNVTPTGSDTDSSGVRIMRAYPTLAKLSVPSNALSSGSTSAKPLYRFSITANNGDIAVYKWTFNVSSSSIVGTTSTYGLYAYTNSGLSAIDSTFTSDGLINYGNCVNGRNDIADTTAVTGVTDSPSPIIEVYPDKGTTACNATTTYIIPSGLTRYFEFNASVVGVEAISGVQTNVEVRLEGDAAYPVTPTNNYGTMDLASVIDSDTHDDFIWSPISTTTSNSRFDVDWTSGYLVDGLPTTNMSIEYFLSTN